MWRQPAGGAAALLLVLTACTASQPHAVPTPSSTATSSPVFTPQAFQPGLWPFATKADVTAYRSDPSSYPWATDRVAVAEHFARDVLRLTDVKGVAHCARACSNVDLYVAGRHVGGVWLAAEKDAEPTVYSAGGAYTPDVQASLELGSFSSPAVAFGTVTRAVGPMRVSLQTPSGRVLATTTTPTEKGVDWSAVLSPAETRWGRGVLVMTTYSGDRLAGLTAVGVQQRVPAAPVARVRCGTTQLAVVQPDEFRVGYTGDRSFGFYVANTGRAPCVLDGYADLRFTDAEGVVPFRIARGSSMGYRDPGPHRVVIRSGGAAVFAVDKYRCDSGGDRTATRMRIRLPGLASALLPVRVPHCKDGPAGNDLTETALAASRAELSR